MERVASELSHWLGASTVSGFSLTPSSGPIRLVPDLDTLPALAGEREALWASLEKTSFLTTDEKRALAGFSPVPTGVDAKRVSEAPGEDSKLFNPKQPRIPAGDRTGGQWANGDGEGGDNVVPREAAVLRAPASRF